MTGGWTRFLLCSVMALLFVAGCSNASGKPSIQERNVLVSKLDAVEKVSVLTTDGEEIFLDMSAIKKEFPQTSQEIYRSTDRLKESDVRYTLLAYRQNQAPLVFEIGEMACQFEDVTYRGKDARTFYQKIAELAGRALLAGQHVQSIELSAVDKGDLVHLKNTQSQELWQIFRQASYQVKPDLVPYPLYPLYSLKLDFGNRVREITVLTPSLVTFKLGNDVLYFRVSGSLFSLLTKQIAPKPAENDRFDQLFRADKIYILSSANKAQMISDAADPIIWESMAHQFIRALKEGSPREQKTSGAEKEIYKIILTMGNTKKEISVFESGFVFDGRVFKQHRIVKQIEGLLGTYKLLGKSG